MSDTSDNRMGSMPVGRLLARMSLPMMLSFFIQALYNIVDSIFVARLSEDALTAVSLAFPMQMGMHAIAVGMGVGINAGVPRAIGEGNRSRAGKITGNAVTLDVLFILLFLVLSRFSNAIYAAQTDVSAIVTGGTTYLSILWMVSEGEFFGQLFEKLLVCTGRPVLAMTSQALGAVFNIVFDPLLIFGIGPSPRLGIAGAAIATVLGQVLGAVTALVMNLLLNHAVKVRASDFVPSGSAVTEILSVGFPSMVTIGLSSLSSFLINQILLTYSTTATAVYGIWAKLQNFCYMPVFGMNNGMVPILSYNHAAGKTDRVRKTFSLALSVIVCLEMVLFLVLFRIPGELLTLFDASDNMRSIGIPALRICLVSLPFGGATIIMTTAMQSLRHASYALAGNILRQFVFLYAAFSLLSAMTHSLSLIWVAVPLSEVLSFVSAMILMIFMRRELLGQRKE
jgi:putative MATE family efflux protein